MVNRKKFKIIIIPFGIVFVFSFFLFSFEETRAELIWGQQLISGSQVELVVDPSISHHQTLGNITSSTTINSISVRGKRNIETTQGNFQLLSCFNGTWDTASSPNCSSGNTGVLTTGFVTIPETATIETYTFSFTTSTTTSSNHGYLIRLHSGLGGTYNFNTIAGSTNADAWPTGQFIHLNGDQTTVKDVYFKLGTNLLGGSLSNPIQITIPQQNSVINSLDKWGLIYEFSTSTPFGICNNQLLAGFFSSLFGNTNNCPTSNFTLAVRYSTTTIDGNSLSFNANFADTKPIFSQFGSTTINRHQALGAGDYQAQGLLIYTPPCNQNPCQQSFIFATSTVISFSLTQSLNQQGFIENVLESFFEGNVTQNQNILQDTFASTTSACTGSIFQNFSKECILEISAGVFNGLIFPHEFSINLVQGSFTQFSSVFPFNLLYNYTDTIQAALASTTNKTGVAINFPINLPGQSTNVEILNEDTLQTLTGTSTKNVIYEYLETAIWIGTGLMLIGLIL